MKFVKACLLFVPLLVAVQDTRKSQPAGPTVGKAAPVFRLNDHAGKVVRVGGESKTWTVVAFYPKAATRG